MTESGKTSEVFDVIVIGGGPAGLSAAMYAARAELNTLVLDKNPAAGALGHASTIENYPGILEKKSGLELLGQFRRQAESYGAKLTRAQVVGVDFSKIPREVMTGDMVYRGKTVILATGNMGRTPSIPGEEQYIGRGISYCADCDAPFFRDLTVAVVGYMNRILEEIETIARFAGRLYLLTPQKSVSEEETKIIENLKIDLIPGSKVTEIHGDQNVVTTLRYTDDVGEYHHIDIDGAFIFLRGNKPVVDYLFGQVELTSYGCISVNKFDMSTSVEGVFAVGDVTCKNVRQIAVATGEGCIGALSAEKIINKREMHLPQWK